MLKGRVLKFGDDITTDQLAPSPYLSTFADNIAEMAKHTLEFVDPTFVSRVKPGDFLVAGERFGIGSSREQAALVLKEAGVSAVLTPSVARIFFRNAINIGLPVLICDTGKMCDGDDLEIDLQTGGIRDVTNGIHVSFDRLPQVMLDILSVGGLIPYVKKHGRFIL